MSKEDMTDGIDVTLNPAKVLRSQLRLLVKQVKDSSRAVRLSPGMCQEVGILSADDALVCSNYNSRWRIERLGQFVDRNVTAPFPGVGRTIIGNTAVAGLSNRHDSSGVI